VQPLAAEDTLAHDVVDHRPDLLMDVRRGLRAEVRQAAQRTRQSRTLWLAAGSRIGAVYPA
jgi:hypothetical protein